jgi:hypothetical protein
MNETFIEFARYFRKSNHTKTNRKSTLPKPSRADREARRRQLIEQIAKIRQELSNVPELSDGDRRILPITRALAFLLTGGR